MALNEDRRSRAAELEREAKELRRQEQAFLKEADARREELLARWGIHRSRFSDAGRPSAGAEPPEDPSESPIL